MCQPMCLGHGLCREAGAAFLAATAEHSAAGSRFSASEKPVCAGALSLFRLVRSSHEGEYTQKD